MYFTLTEIPTEGRPSPSPSPQPAHSISLLLAECGQQASLQLQLSAPKLPRQGNATLAAPVHLCVCLLMHGSPCSRGQEASPGAQGQCGCPGRHSSQSCSSGQHSCPCSGGDCSTLGPWIIQGWLVVRLCCHVTCSLEAIAVMRPTL